jgi:hypothetical protein
MVHLKNQIGNNTIEYTVLPSRLGTIGDEATTRWDIEIWNVALGSTVLGVA